MMLCVLVLCFIVFFKQKTAYEVRISDWSSDVCSSDLPGVARDDREVEHYDAGAALSWEIDLFGRVRRGVEARRAEAWASASDLDAMQIAVVRDRKSVA